MKILHLSTGDNRGAFTAAYRTHRNLLDAGHISKLFVADKRTKDIDITQIKGGARCLWKFLSVFDKIFLRFFVKEKTRIKHCFFLDYPHTFIFNSMESICNERFDLIIVYYTSNFLSIEQIKKISQHYKAKVAFYLMDMGPMTGGCHYAWSCTGYLKGCYACSVTSSKIHQQLISNETKRRYDAYHELNPIVISGSGWLSKQAKDSHLFSSFQHEKILIGLDPDIYSPKWRYEIREKLGFNENEIVIYFGAQNINDPRKGFEYLNNALIELSSKISPDKLSRLKILTIGKLDKEIDSLKSFKHIHIPYISNEIEFAKIYSGVDLFVCPSIEDSGPMMINESILSGTPVLAFKMGVAIDLIINDQTGYLVELENSTDLCDYLMKFINLSLLEKNSMREYCRNLGMLTTTKINQINCFSSLVEKLK